MVPNRSKSARPLVPKPTTPTSKKNKNIKIENITDLSEIEVEIMDGAKHHSNIKLLLPPHAKGSVNRSELVGVLTDFRYSDIISTFNCIDKVLNTTKDYINTSDDYLCDSLSPFLGNFITPAASHFAKFEKNTSGILHRDDHYTAFFCGEDNVIAFETLPSRYVKTYCELNTMFSEKIVVICPISDQTSLKVRNTCGPLSIIVLLSGLEYTSEELIKYAFLEEPLPDEYPSEEPLSDEYLSDIIEEDDLHTIEQEPIRLYSESFDTIEVYKKNDIETTSSFVPQILVETSNDNTVVNEVELETETTLLKTENATNITDYQPLREELTEDQDYNTSDYDTPAGIPLSLVRKEGKIIDFNINTTSKPPSTRDPRNRIRVRDPKEEFMDNNATGFEKFTSFARFLNNMLSDLFPTDLSAVVVLSLGGILAGLIGLFIAIRDGVKRNVALITVSLAAIAFQLMSIIAYCDNMTFSFADSVDALVHVIKMLNPLSGSSDLDKTTKPEYLLESNPDAAQLLQYRQHFKQISDDERLITILHRFPPRLLTRDELRWVAQEDRKAVSQIDSDFLLSLADKALYPLALVISIFGIAGPFATQTWIKNLRSIFKKTKEDYQNIAEVKESLLNFFMPEKSHSHLIIRQRENNLLAIQPAIAEVILDQTKYANLLKCSADSKMLYNGIMSRDGKNEIYKSFTHSASLVESKLFEIRKVIDSGYGKQEPVAVHFFGELGIGKTTFILRTLVNDLAKRLSLPATTFNTRINADGFYSLYGGQTFAYIDEVGDRSDSSSVYDLINQIVSTGTVNIPSAFVKDQPFLSRFLFCISNFDLKTAASTSLKKPESVTALRSRFISVEISNPKVDANSVRGANPDWFKRENFIFNLHDNNLKQDVNGKKECISYDRLLDILAQSYELKLQTYRDHITSSGAHTQAAREPFAITIAGPQHSGKTTFAENFATRLGRIFNQPISRYDNTIPTEFEEGGIVFMNDVLTVSNKSTFNLHALESLGGHGVIINTTNVIRQQIPFYQFFLDFTLFKILIVANATYFEDYKFVIPPIYQKVFDNEGMYRRLGFAGSYYQSYGCVVDVTASTSVYVKTTSGFQYVLNKESYTSDSLEHELASLMDKHRSASNVQTLLTSRAEREDSDWHVYIRAKDIPQAVMMMRDPDIPKLLCSKPTDGKIAIRDMNTLSDSTFNPEILSEQIVNVDNFIERMSCFITYLSRKIPTLNIVVEVSNTFYWTKGSKIYTNYVKPKTTYREIEDHIIFNDKDETIITAKTFVDYYLDRNRNVPITTALLLDDMIVSLAIPKICENDIQAEIQKESDEIQIRAMDAWILEAKVFFKESVLFKVICVLITGLVTFTAGTLIYKTFSSTTKDKAQKQGRRNRKCFGTSKNTGKRYVIRESGVVYSDNENWNEALYADILDRDSGADSDNQDYSNKIMREEQRAYHQDAQFTKNVRLQPDYFDNLREYINSSNGYNTHVIIPRGSAYINQNIKFTKSGNNSDFFVMRCGSEIIFDNLRDLLTYDNNISSFGFSSFAEMRNYVRDIGTPFVVLSRGKVSNAYIGVTASDMNEILEGNVEYISTVIDRKINTNRLVNLDNGMLMPISINELRTKPEGRISGIREFSAAPRRYFEIITTPAKQQSIDFSYRKTTPLDNVIASIRKNAVRVRGPIGGLNGFFISEGIILTPGHILENIELEDVTVEEEFDGETKIYKPFSCSIDEDHDVCLLYVKGSHGHRSLMKYISDEPPSDLPCTTAIIGLAQEPTLFVNVKRPLRDILMADSPSSWERNNVYAGLLTCLPNQPLTANGDCGRPYINISGQDPKIFAIHIALQGASAIGYRLNKEWISQNLGAKQQGSLLRYDKPSFDGSKHLTLIGKSPRVIQSPNKPYAEPSDLANYLAEICPNMKCPAKVSLSECTPEEIEKLGVDASGKPDFYIGQIEQYNDLVKDFPLSDANDFVAGFYAQNKNAFDNNRAGHIANLDQVLNGFQDRDDPLCYHANPLNWNGSVGYEFRTKFPHIHTMGDLVDHEDGKATFKNTPEARFVVEKYIRHVVGAYNGIKEIDVMQDNLKQELRLSEKAYKQRVFTSCPKSLSMFVRTMTLRFASILTKYHLTMPYKIGVNSAAEWHTYAQQMECFAGKKGMGFGFDLSRCDKHITRQFFEVVLRGILEKLVESEHSKDRCNCRHTKEQHLAAIGIVIEQLYNNVIASQDMLYEKNRGNSSGSDLTIVINSIYIDYILFSWFKQQSKISRQFPPTWEAYQRLVFRMLCGDDGKIIVNGFYDFLNFKTFKTYMGEHGVEVDSPLKDGNDQPLYPMHEIPFISRGWCLTKRGLYIPKFKIEIISGLIYWAREHTLEHYEDILRQLSEFILPYGRKIYDTFYDGALSFVSDVGSSIIIPTYKEALLNAERQVHGLALSQMKVLEDQVSRKTNEIITNKMSVYEVENPECAPFVSFVGALAIKANPKIKETSSHYQKILATAEAFFTQPATKTTRSWKRSFTNVRYAEPLDQAVLISHTLQELVKHRIRTSPGTRYAFELKTLRALVRLIQSKNPIMAESQMDRQTQGSAIPQATQMENPGINAAINHTMNAHAPATMALPVEHLPQLATMLPGQGIPTMVNTPINNTMEDGPLIEARTTYLPTTLMSFGGIVEDFKDIAVGSYQVVEVLSVPVNTQQGTVIFKKSYGLDMLGGFARRWVNLHQRYSGPIQFKISIIASTITQGLLRIGYNQGENTPINIANSSKFGAVDFDLSKDNNDIFFTIRPTSDGKFFFRTDEDPGADQGFIFGLLLTQLTNNFSELGAIQIIIQSRLHPEFCVADPLEDGITPGPTTSNSLQQTITASGANQANSTLFIESRMYPKYPDTAAQTAMISLFDPTFTKRAAQRVVGIVTGIPNTGSTHTFTNSFGFTNTSVSVSGQPLKMEMNALDTSQAFASRYTSYAVPTQTMNWKYTNTGNPEETVPAVYKVLSTVMKGYITTFDQLSIELPNSVAALAGEEGEYVPFTANPDVPASTQITAVYVANTLDNKTLPGGYFTVEIGPVSTPSVSAAALAQNLNIIPRSDLGWVINNWCRANCPATGQIKITVSDPTFSQTILELLYRPTIGFLTTAPSAQAFTYLNANLSGYVFSTTTYADQTAVTLNNDFGGFASMGATSRANPQMFNILGGLLGGIGQGMQNNQNYNNQYNLQQLQGQQQLNNINAQGGYSLQNTALQGKNSLNNILQQGRNTAYNTNVQAYQQRQTSAFNQSLSNLGNNMMHSPQNNASARNPGPGPAPFSVDNTTGATCA
uniref:SF3 helicase domain-containing protein n=1 Tax=Riboviria sp. TaxID=2585031 RepID=A0A6M9Z7Q8_9VIRU|nr:MAG: hypothetical protein [Riboviria sp.]